MLTLLLPAIPDFSALSNLPSSMVHMSVESVEYNFRFYFNSAQPYLSEFFITGLTQGTEGWGEPPQKILGTPRKLFSI